MSGRMGPENGQHLITSLIFPGSRILNHICRKLASLRGVWLTGEAKLDLRSLVRRRADFCLFQKLLGVPRSEFSSGESCASTLREIACSIEWALPPREHPGAPRPLAVRHPPREGIS